MSDSPQQNFANHTKFVPAYHYLLAPLTIVAFVWSVSRAITTRSADSLMSLLVAVVLVLLVAQVRTFPLKVQDRLIRLEEQLRLMRLLPADMQSRIAEFSVDQLVALRFASDAELPELARRVLAEKLTERKRIKAEIRNWRPDLFRM